MQCACVMSCQAVQYFSTLPHQRQEIRKKNIEHKMCVSTFSTNLSETFLIPRRTERDVIKIYIGLHIKCPLFLSDLKETLIFSTDFRKNSISNFMKIHPVGAEFHAGRRRDRETDRHDETNIRLPQI